MFTYTIKVHCLRLLLSLFVVTYSTALVAQDTHEDSDMHSEHSGEGNEIHLSAQQLQQLDIQTDVVAGGSASAVVEAPATVHFNGNRVARVGPLLNSRVLEIVRDLGDEVNEGDTLAILESVELGRIKASYLAARARAESRQAEYNRDQQLAEQQIISEAHLLETRAVFLETQAELDALRAELRLYGLNEAEIDAISTDSDLPLSHYRLVSPLAGVIQRRDLVLGQNLAANQTPVHIVNTDSLWLYIDVFEQDLSNMAAGQPVSFNARGLGQRVFHGNTNWISRELDETSRTLRVRAVLENPDQNLRAGMFGTAQIITESATRLPLVPVNAIQNIGEGEQVVFVPGHESGAYLAQHVTTGDEAGGMVEIQSGIAIGDTVVVSGAFDLMSALTAGGRSADHSH